MQKQNNTGPLSDVDLASGEPFYLRLGVGSGAERYKSYEAARAGSLMASVVLLHYLSHCEPLFVAL